MPRELRIADRCREFGLVVKEVDGWKTRGSDSFSPVGVIDHHDGGAPTGDMPSLGVLINGRSDLPGPLCQVGLGRSGTAYIVAGGRANHGGQGAWNGASGNSKFFGIEAANDGRQPWPDVQVAAYHRLNAALLSLTPNRSAEWLCAHREYATPAGRKPDPHTLDMNWMRARAAEILAGITPAPIPIEEDEDYMVTLTAGSGAVIPVVGSRTSRKLIVCVDASDKPQTFRIVPLAAGIIDITDKWIVQPWTRGEYLLPNGTTHVRIDWRKPEPMPAFEILATAHIE